MNRKKKIQTSLLLLVVITVWGLIIHRVFSAFNDDITEESPLISGTDKFQEHQVELNVSNGIDPFGLSSFPRRVNREQALQTSINDVEVSEPVLRSVSWPNIKLLGILNGEISQVVILSVDGQVHPFKARFSHVGIEVVEVVSDSVLLEFEDETKWYELE
ncbi:MAG: hypothetical protein HWD92_03130 [Flavobacteriia bacterium]|nr:hypothetical protein [Flavobacteriia bacterium]